MAPLVKPAIASAHRCAEGASPPLTLQEVVVTRKVVAVSSAARLAQICIQFSLGGFWNALR